MFVLGFAVKCAAFCRAQSECAGLLCVCSWAAAFRAYTHARMALLCAQEMHCTTHTRVSAHSQSPDACAWLLIAHVCLLRHGACAGSVILDRGVSSVRSARSVRVGLFAQIRSKIGEHGLNRGREHGLNRGREHGFINGREHGMNRGREHGLNRGREHGLIRGRVHG